MQPQQQSRPHSASHTGGGGGGGGGGRRHFVPSLGSLGNNLGGLEADLFRQRVYPSSNGGNRPQEAWITPTSGAGVDSNNSHSTLLLQQLRQQQQQQQQQPRRGGGGGAGAGRGFPASPSSSDASFGDRYGKRRLRKLDLSPLQVAGPSSSTGNNGIGARSRSRPTGSGGGGLGLGLGPSRAELEEELAELQRHPGVLMINGSGSRTSSGDGRRGGEDDHNYNVEARLRVLEAWMRRHSTRSARESDENRLANAEQTQRADALDKKVRSSERYLNTLTKQNADELAFVKDSHASKIADLEQSVARTQQEMAGLHEALSSMHASLLELRLNAPAGGQGAGAPGGAVILREDESAGPSSFGDGIGSNGASIAKRNMTLINQRFSDIEAMVRDEQAKRTEIVKGVSSNYEERFQDMHAVIDAEAEERRTFEKSFRDFMTSFQTEVREVVSLVQHQGTEATAALEQVLRAEVTTRMHADKKIAEAITKRHKSIYQALHQLRSDVKDGFSFFTNRLKKLDNVGGLKGELQKIVAEQMRHFATRRDVKRLVVDLERDDLAREEQCHAFQADVLNHLRNPLSMNIFMSRREKVRSSVQDTLQSMDLGPEELSEVGLGFLAQKEKLRAEEEELKSQSVDDDDDDNDDDDDDAPASGNTTPSANVNDASSLVPEAATGASTHVNDDESPHGTIVASIPLDNSRQSDLNNANGAASAGSQSFSEDGKSDDGELRRGSTEYSASDVVAADASAVSSENEQPASLAKAASSSASEARTPQLSAEQLQELSIAQERIRREHAATVVQAGFRGYTTRKALALGRVKEANHERLIAGEPQICERCLVSDAIKTCQQCMLLLCLHCESRTHRSERKAVHNRQWLLSNVPRAGRNGGQAKASATAGVDGASALVAASQAAQSQTEQKERSEFAIELANLMEHEPIIVRDVIAGSVIETSMPSLHPQHILSLPNVIISVDCGLEHSAAVSNFGCVFTWGNNQHGQLGIGTFEKQATPVLVDIRGIVQVACGHRHTLARSFHGRAFSWGDGANGILGHESEDAQTRPQLIRTLSNTITVADDNSCGNTEQSERVVHVAAGADNSGVIVELLDTSAAERTRAPSAVDDDLMAATRAREGGDDSTLGPQVLLPTRVYIWGSGKHGQLAREGTEKSLNPVVIEQLEDVNMFDDRDEDEPNQSASSDDDDDDDNERKDEQQRERRRNRKKLARVVSLSLGSQHVAAVVDTGDVVVWGDNSRGQLGFYQDSDEDPIVPNPTINTSLRHLQVSASMVACGELHTTVLASDGYLWSWGCGDSHQMGVFDNIDQFAPCAVEKIQSSVVSLSVGSNISAAVTDNGDLYLWGFGAETPVPKRIASMRGEYLQAVAVGSEHNVVALTGQAQACFKWSTDIEDLSKAIQIDDLLTGKRLSQISCGSAHTAAVAVNGKVYVWGSNAEGQLGLGASSPAHADVPTALSLSVPISHVCASYMHTVALSRSGQVYTWGNGSLGRLGHGTDKNEDCPRLVSAFSKLRVRAIAASQFNSAAVLSDGALYMWGAGDRGQNGVESRSPSLKPLRVRLRDKGKKVKLVNVSLGDRHGSAISNKGFAYTWGSNEFGQLGFPPEDDSDMSEDDEAAGVEDLERNIFPPGRVKLLQNARLMTTYCGDQCTFFLSEAGQLYSCGAGDTLQLGSGSKNDKYFPDPVRALSKVKIEHIDVGHFNCVAYDRKGRTYAWGWSIGGKPHLVAQLEDERIAVVACGLQEILLASS